MLYNFDLKYRKIPIISPGFIFVQMAFLLGLFLAYHWKTLPEQRNTALKNPANINSAWAYIREGLLSEGFLRLRFGGLTFGRVYFFGGGGGTGAYYRNFKVYSLFWSIFSCITL